MCFTCVRRQWIEGIKDSQILYDFQQGRETPASADEGDGFRRPGPGLDGYSYDEYRMDDHIYGGYSSQSPEVAIDLEDLNEVRLALLIPAAASCSGC